MGFQMPLYDYLCKACGHFFEALVRGSAEPTCPECGAEGPERQLSSFAVSSDGSRQRALDDSRRRSAAVKKEKDHAHIEYLKNHDH